jgi:putative oxidoreductase
MTRPTAAFGVIPRSFAPALHSVLRMMSGLLLLEHGTGKLFGFPAGLPHLDQMPVGMLYFIGLMELIGGILITLGLFTRPAAFVLSGFMAFAFFLAHFPTSFYPVLNGGEAAVLWCFIFLYFAAAGGGPWSVDGE